MVTVCGRPSVGRATSCASDVSGIGAQVIVVVLVDGVGMPEEMTWPSMTIADRLFRFCAGPYRPLVSPQVNTLGRKPSRGRSGPPALAKVCWSITCLSTWPIRYRFRKTSEVTPTTAQTAVISATIPMISLARRVSGRLAPAFGSAWPRSPIERGRFHAGDRSGGGLEDIAEAPHGMDHRFPAGVDLFSEIGNVQLDDIGLPAEIVVPHPVEDLRLRHHPLGLAHEETQQFEFGVRQTDQVVTPPGLPGVLVQHQVADNDRYRVG